MNILVTGGAGYIGSVLVPYLLTMGHNVNVLDNLRYGAHGLRDAWGQDGFRFVGGDILSHRALEEAMDGVDVVIHLAAIVGVAACKKSPELADSVNRVGTGEVMQRAYEHGVNGFILASTCSNYGASPDVPAKEESPLNPLSAYAESKIAAEAAVLLFAQRTEPSFCPIVLRFATVFGTSPRMRLDLMVNEFTFDAWRNKEIVVYNEEAWRPFVHVRDLSRALHFFARAALYTPDLVRGEVFNVGGHNRRKLDLVQALIENAPGLKVRRHSGQNKDPRDYQVDFSKLGKVWSGNYWACRTPELGVVEVLAALQNGLFERPEDRKWRNAWP